MRLGRLIRQTVFAGLVSLPLLAAAGLLTPGAMAQDNAMLVAETLEIAGDTRLVASGGVEVLYKGTRLTASRVVYDKAADRLHIDGPLTLTRSGGTGPQSEVLILASQAELSADLTDGLLQSARIVLDRQLQLAANSIARIDGRYSALDQVVASSCKVCAAQPTPLWEIRARRVVHDETERMIYFDRAQFRIAGVPVAYIPRLRMPDPTLGRASGLLAPSLRTTSSLGPGIKLPYFIALGPSRDLTVTPYLTTRQSKTIELRYRQSYRNGAIELNGALTRDRLTEETGRGYLIAEGAFELENDFILSFGVQVASDNAYLLDYGYSDRDRLDSRIELSRVRRNGLFSARLVSFQTLRDDEDNDTLPSLIGDVTFHRRFSLGPVGGEGGLRLQSHSHYRTSSNPFDSDGDQIADGRDVSRLSARIDWRKSFISAPGIETTVLGEAQLDAYHIREDNLYDGGFTRATAAVGVEFRWPWVKATDSGATHVIEPVVQLIAAGRNNSGIPNEDSVLVEFDEGNLFSLDRFPGSDAVEQSSRANLGLSWTRYDPSGWNMAFVLGKVIRTRNDDGFGPSAGLAKTQSDWLTAGSIDWDNGLSLAGRALFDDSFSLTKSELRLQMATEKLSLATSTLWIVADPQQNRLEPSREWAFDAAWRINPALQAKARGRYDFQSDRGTLAAVGMEYRNECVTVDLSLSRRFTSSDSVSPTTDFGLSVDLIGFGSGKTAGPARRCY